jgi:hypothetical protein
MAAVLSLAISSRSGFWVCMVDICRRARDRGKVRALSSPLYGVRGMKANLVSAMP